MIGLGEIGGSLLAAAQNSGHEVVGAVDSDSEKIGLDAGEVVSLGKNGVKVVADISDVVRSSAVVLQATGSRLNDVAQQLHACIHEGFNVVSTCEELAYPWKRNAELAKALDRASRARRVTVMSAGINPGFAMDTFALAASVPCLEVRSVKAVRVVDARTRRRSLHRKIGLGLEEKEFEREAASGRIGHVGLEESAWLLAERLDLRATKLTREIRPILDSLDGSPGRASIPATVKGLRQVVVLHRSTVEVVRLDLTMAVGIGEARDEVILDAQPRVHIVVPGGFAGDAGTAGVVLNAARQVSAAEPGLLTVADLGLPHARGRGGITGSGRRAAGSV